MTRHTLRDLMIGLQWMFLTLAGVSIFRDDGYGVTAAVVLAIAAKWFTPSRLPPRNERGQFSKRD